MKKTYKIAIILIVILLSTVLFACNKNIDCTISFEVDGEIVQTISKGSGSEIAMPTNPIKEGYTFGGWYWDKDVWEQAFTANSLLDASIKREIKVYAKWNQVFTITFNSMDGSSASSITAENNSILAQPTSPTRNGYLFVGWFRDADYGTRWNFVSDKVTAGATLYARWEIINYDITYNSIFSTVNSNPTNYDIETATITLADLSGRTGYTFTGWYTSSSGGTKVTSIPKGSSGDKALYARWEIINYDITYNSTFGTVNSNPSTYTIESNTITLSALTGTGWYTSSSGGTKVTSISKGSSGAITLTAIWEIVEYIRSGNYIYFGEYPQTIKTSSVTVGTTVDSRGYYLGSDGSYYAKITATPHISDYQFSTDEIVTSGTVYYFKVEPIKWRILSESNGEALILCESIIANKRYNEDYDGIENEVYANNYEESEIRAWLNNEFYYAAFTSLQQERILVTNVDNSVYSTGYDPNLYACANTNDKIFLPSYREMINTAYGFNSSLDRERLTSDYSRATGAYMYIYSRYYGNGWWWLRSPYHNYSDRARKINFDGSIYYDNVSSTTYGVVPALKIKLS